MPAGLLNATAVKKECSPPAGAPRPEGAGDPDPVVLLQDAVAKQLGLKLVLEKRPIPAFVVDSIQDKPTEN